MPHARVVVEGGAVPSSRGFDALVSALPAVACTCLCCTVSLTSCPCVARWAVPCRWVGRSRVREGSMHCQLHLLLPRNLDACMHACQGQLQMQPMLGCCICHHGALVCRPPGCAYGAAGVCCSAREHRARTCLVASPCAIIATCCAPRCAIWRALCCAR